MTLDTDSCAPTALNGPRRAPGAREDTAVTDQALGFGILPRRRHRAPSLEVRVSQGDDVFPGLTLVLGVELPQRLGNGFALHFGPKSLELFSGHHVYLVVLYLLAFLSINNLDAELIYQLADARVEVHARGGDPGAPGQSYYDNLPAPGRQPEELAGGTRGSRQRGLDLRHGIGPEVLVPQVLSGGEA